MALTPKRREQNTNKYNIFNAMKCPKLFGKDMSAVNVVTTTVDNLSAFATGYPLSGMDYEVPYGKTVETDTGPFYAGRDYALGSNYFIPIGNCDATSEDNCAGKNRYVYLRNIPTGKIPLIGNISFHGLTGCNLPGVTEGRGLLSGMLEDVSDIQPLSLLENLGGGGNYGGSKCKRVTLPVGTHIYDPKMQCKPNEDCSKKSWYLETRCSPSYKYMKTATTGRAQKFPGAKPLFNLESFVSDSGRPHSSAARAATGKLNKKVGTPLWLPLMVSIAIVVLIVLVNDYYNVKIEVS